MARSLAACARSAAVSVSRALSRSLSFCRSSGAVFSDFHNAAAWARRADVSSDGAVGSCPVERSATGLSSQVSSGSTTRRERAAGTAPTADLPGAVAPTRAEGRGAVAAPGPLRSEDCGRKALAGAAALSLGRVACAMPVAAEDAAELPPPTAGELCDSAPVRVAAEGSRVKSTGDAEADRVTVVGRSERKV